MIDCDWNRPSFMDQRVFARDLNLLYFDERVSPNMLKYYFRRSETSCKVNALDLEWIVGALKKAGAEEVKKEPVKISVPGQNNMATLELSKPLRFDVQYKGKLDMEKFKELIYN